MNWLSDYSGRLHPVLLHFPITLLWLAALLEAARWRADSSALARASIWLLGLGLLSTVAAAGSGWLLAAHEHIRQDQQTFLAWHRWLGVATGALALVAWRAACRWREDARPGQRVARRALIWSSTLVLTAAAHLGATIVWGADWFL
jgi:uncharacterized membrane protein